MIPMSKMNTPYSTSMGHTGPYIFGWVLRVAMIDEAEGEGITHPESMPVNTDMQLPVSPTSK